MIWLPRVGQRSALLPADASASSQDLLRNFWTSHLAENKQDEEHPFAFLATYAGGLSERGEAKHLPLARALQEYAGGSNRKRLVALLTPIREASERLPWVQDLVEGGDIYQALAWTPAEAHRLLRDVPTLETSGLIVRIPNWWKADHPPRPQVSIKVGGRQVTSLGADSLLDFSISVTLGGEALSESEKRELLSSAGGLVRLRGQWVEADGERLAAALAHWKSVETEARSGGISFFEGMRLLAGTSRANDPISEAPMREWSRVEPGDWLRDLLARVRNPEGGSIFGIELDPSPKGRPQAANSRRGKVKVAGVAKGGGKSGTTKR